jgi:sugar/nucleoside kinase (ribokinase family)
MYDITIIGNAPVDNLFHVDDALLKTYALKKGDWQKLPVATYDALTADLTSRGIHNEMIPGGSGANTAWHLSRMGRKVFFAGLVGDDAAGVLFHQSMTDAGVDMTPPVAGLATFVLICLVTPDGERTFVSNGLTPDFTPEDVPEHIVAQSRYLMLEGYLLGTGFPALLHAAHLGDKHGAKLILTLAAPSFVNQFFENLATLLREDHTNLFFANDKELDALRNQMHNITDPDVMGKTLNALYLTNHVVTHGAQGAEYYHNGSSHGLVKPQLRVPQVLDATGAGDAFAAGFLHVWLADPTNVAEAIQAGHTLAGKVIAHLGARPNVSIDS